MDKLVSIQWLRGLAAIGVVWFHAMFLITNNGLHSYQTEYGDIRQIGSIGVDVFFVISGFIVSISAANAVSVKAFVQNRLLRVWPLYALATLLFVLVSPGPVGLGDLLMSLALMQPVGPASMSPTLPPGWTLLFEATFYAVVTAALLWRSRRSLAERITLIVAGLVILGSAYGFARPFNVLSLNIIGNPITLEFVLGVVIGRFWTRGYRLPSWGASALFAAGAFFILRDAMHGMSGEWLSGNTLDGTISWERLRTWGVYSALIVASATLREPVPEGRGRFLAVLGDASYSIYLFHMHVQDWLLHRLDLFGAMAADGIILCATLVSVVVGVIAHYVLERPILTAVKAWRSRQPVPTVRPEEHRIP
ncbi:acyltransferase [Stenotrophomonas sp. ESTM1D_MKCIP4_1]|uniref:acyltransferase family protein n=1 Tax=Stenotrophomonas sp. ESTM1D_MKCIP4_1 TaxID=2072414 RepID=UPI00131F485E|nr:acyltransferase [Stenotrophomonas sp. ESTM1D_MKCIP4_1]